MLEKMQNFPGIWSKIATKMWIILQISDFFGKKKTEIYIKMVHFPSKLQRFPSKSENFPGMRLPNSALFQCMYINNLAIEDNTLQRSIKLYNSTHTQGS